MLLCSGNHGFLWDGAHFTITPGKPVILLGRWKFGITGTTHTSDHSGNVWGWLVGFSGQISSRPHTFPTMVVLVKEIPRYFRKIQVGKILHIIWPDWGKSSFTQKF